MMASRRGSGGNTSSCCALCEGSNLPSCCSACVNSKLAEYHAKLRMMKNLRDSLNARIATRLDAKRKGDEQRNWRLKKKRNDSSVMHTNAMKAAQMGLMATTSEHLKMQSKAMKQLCRLFPLRRVIKDGEQNDGYNGPYDVICNARLPRGLDPHSVPSEELSASLGYMLQLISIAVPILAAPALHVSGFGASCSRVWQRSSYWSTRQSQSKVYPLFIPRKNNCSVGEDNSWTESGSGNFGVQSVDSDNKSVLDSKRSNSFNFSIASSHSMERHQDLQRGISLLKTSVTAITTYYYNSLGMDVPSNLSTFEAFAKLLHMLSSLKVLRTTLQSNVASRSEKQGQQLNRSIWKASSAISSNSSLMDSVNTAIMPSSLDNLLLNSNTSFLYSGKPTKHGGVPDNILEGWDMSVTSYHRHHRELKTLRNGKEPTPSIALAPKRSDEKRSDPRVTIARRSLHFTTKRKKKRKTCASKLRPLSPPPPRPNPRLPASPAMSGLRAISTLLHTCAAAAAGGSSRRVALAPPLGRSFRVPWRAPSAFVFDEVARAAGGERRRVSTRAASWDSEKSPYETLELDRDADEETIKTAYRRLAKFYHPDVYDGKGTLEEGETAEARFIKIQAAYELLIDDQRRKSYDREHHVNPMKASQAWMEWVMKKRKAFDQRGDMAVAAWAEQQHREMTLRARRLSRSKIDPEEERKLFAKEKKASMDFYSTTLKRHTLVLRKRDIMRKKAEEDKKKEISRLLALEGLELDTDEDDNINFLK
uniref:J domain-containing protein n=1 Tax=Oryza meridionalis TaxID=40149 RepID=A0A0E0EEP1_9ORYZ